MQQYHNSIFWVETEKIKPNPYQPRKEFDPRALQDLADSIRQYGVLQPLVVTRKEFENEQGLFVEYELIAGERRLRASKIAEIPQVPVIIRAGHDTDKEKLELAIIENLQREDLNPIDRAEAFLRLAEEFKLTHAEIGKKMGKSREYVSNTLRLLALPPEIRVALAERKIAEGHTRPLMMLTDRPAEQMTLFKEMVIKKLSVRESERIARGIASDKVRKKELLVDPEIAAYQEKLAESLGTRVSIEKKEVGGKIVIDYFSPHDLATILELLKSNEVRNVGHMMDRFIASNTAQLPVVDSSPAPAIDTSSHKQELHASLPVVQAPEIVAPVVGPSYLEEDEPELHQPAMLDDRDHADIHEEEHTDLYNLDSFTL
jgi:ParB family chromosome partitioning protein